MHAIKRQRNVSAKALTALSIVLVLAVFRHISRANSFVSNDGEDSSSQELGGRRSLFFRTPRHTPPVKRCIARGSTLPPTLPTEEGAVGDIKRITADWEHISAYVQSCDFQSKQNISNAVPKTRGIVIPSAGHAMFAHTWVVVTILRETLGCSLPIEVVFNGQEELDVNLAERLRVCTTSCCSCLAMQSIMLVPLMLLVKQTRMCTDSTADMCAATRCCPSGQGATCSCMADDSVDAERAFCCLQMMSNVTLVDASLISLPSHHRPMNWTQVFGQAKYVHATGYSFKAYVLAFVTKFDEVLVLDSDNLPLQNPEALFESPQYLKKGSSFWPDWWQRSRTQQIPFFLDVDPFAYSTFGLQAPWEVSDHPMTATESGTMMLDRSVNSLCIQSTLLVMHAMAHNPVINRTGMPQHFAHYQTAHTMHANSGIVYDLNVMQDASLQLKGDDTLSLSCSLTDLWSLASLQGSGTLLQELLLLRVTYQIQCLASLSTR